MERLAAMRQEEWGQARLGGLVPLVELVKPKQVLEIGAYAGVSAEVFLLYGATVLSIDPWPDHLQDVYAACLRRLEVYPHWRHLRGESPAALMHLRDKAYDLVYIDGDHSERAVRADIASVRRLVAPGGWIGGHDYDGPATPGVKRAVDDMLGKPTHVFSDSNFLCGPYP